MAAQISESVRKMMLARQAEIKERMTSGNFTKSWNLTGKNAIVNPGEQVVVRFGPRWDIVIEQNGKLVKNPDYVSGAEPIFVIAFEHWWDADGNKTQHEWCPKTYGPDEECPICVYAQALTQAKANPAEGLSEEEAETRRKEGKRIAAKETFIFNAVVGQAGARRLADGKADFRIMAVPGTVFTAIVDIMTGGSDESFARGNIGDQADGYDIKLSRPAKGGNDRWQVQCAPNPTPLYDQKQAAAFANWPSLMVNLEKMLEKEMKSATDLFKAFFGRDPEEGGAEEAAVQEAPEAQPAAQESTPAPDLADEFLPQPAAGQKAAPAPAPKVSGTAPARALPRTGGRR
jgi:hypothetical protein